MGLIALVAGDGGYDESGLITSRELAPPHLPCSRLAGTIPAYHKLAAECGVDGGYGGQ